MAPQEERPLLGAGVGLGAWCQMSRGKAIVSSLLREKEECTINFSISQNTANLDNGLKR